ncbi:WD repeat-containing protein 37 isoform X2 [Hydra vulgaris]|uniref:WD repeat-containing protein 37 n=1 Tax=Hydra vulgaris TaxID=6087 RepID=A0ABM4CYL7_HYDVU
MEKNEKLDNKSLTSSFKAKQKNLLHKKLSGQNKDHIANEEDQRLPPALRRKLRGLFQQIEQEFESIMHENVVLQEKLELMTEKYKILVHNSQEKTEKPDSGIDYPEGISFKEDSHISKGTKKPSASQIVSQKLKTKYRASTSKFVSSFKMPNAQVVSLYCHMVQKYVGHRDGIWEVSSSKGNVVATASADRTARVWNVETCQCLISYHGHTGSVNSVRFHPNDSLLCTGSGDGTCHLWKLQTPVVTDFRRHSPVQADANSVGSGEDEQEEDIETDTQHMIKVKTPLVQLSGHDGPVSSADWWTGGTQVVSASWDRTVKLWDVEKTNVIHTLEGHELEITHLSVNSLQKLIVTSSQDTTFRLWDFRLPSMHSVNVFQGHTDTVTSAVFTNKADHVVSGSDDRTVKVWDLKNMRSPIATIRLDSAVNRLSLSPNQSVIAIPHDNRHVRLYDLSGNRLSRLPRQQRQGHERIVCSTCWLDDTSTKSVQLMTAGFDKQLIGWNIIM